MEKKENIRELVTDMVTEITAGREKSHILIRNVLDKYSYLPGHDRSFIKKVTEGTLERLVTIDYVLNSFSKVPVNKMKPFIRSLMRMSVYQILYLDKVPDSAACNEAVKLAQKRGFGPLKAFVNGILRNVARNKDAIDFPDKKKDFVKYLSVTYSVPEYIARLLLSQYGEKGTEEILKGYLMERPVCVRVSQNISAIEKDKVLQNWSAIGIEAKKHPWLDYAYELYQAGGMKDDENFNAGLYTVQDVSSMLVAQVAGVEAGMQILDVCAAPGGKATHAAEKLKGTGQVIARDLTEYKVNFILENADRLQLLNLWAEEWDACVFDEVKEEWADILFCDVPCSGLGVMGKKRDIKYRLTPDSLKEVQELQQQILNTVWKYVKKDGILMYSTCTINREENEKQVQWIVENLPFEVVSMKEELPEKLRADEGEYGLQLLPGIHETDGFFLCKLRRIKCK